MKGNFSMKEMVKIGLLLSLPAVSLNAAADYNDILWKGDDVLRIVVDPFLEDSLVSKISVLSGLSQFMTAVVSDCSDFSGYGFNATSHWLMYPVSGSGPGGMSWKLSFTNSNGEKLFKGSQLGSSDDYMLMQFSTTTKKMLNDKCVATGERKIVDLSTSASFGTLTINPGHARPGYYNFTIPMAWGIEDNKYKQPPGGQLWRQMGALLERFSIIQVPISFVLRSRCSFDTAQINLSHGTISLKKNVLSYPSDRFPLAIDCHDSVRSVSLSLRAVDPVPGKPENYTRCGSGGVCRLTFDTENQTDIYKETLNFTHVNNIYLKSDYLPGEGVVAGDFTGNGILTITIN